MKKYFYLRGPNVTLLSSSSDRDQNERLRNILASASTKKGDFRLTDFYFTRFFSSGEGPNSRSSSAIFA